MNTSVVWPFRAGLRSLTAELRRGNPIRTLPWKRVRGSAARVLDLQEEERALTRSTDVLCRLADIPDGGVLGLNPPDPAGFPLLLMREGDRLHGWLNVCPQDGRRMDVAPGLFHVEHGELHCAVRGAVFALRDGGRCISGPCRGRPLVPVPLRIEQGQVLRDHRSARAG